MKDAVITVRVPMATRRRLQRLARREGRSLSQQVERLIERGMAVEAAPAVRGVRSLAGLLRVARVPSLADFRQVRGQLSTALAGRSAERGQRRR